LRNPDGDGAPPNSAMKSVAHWLYARHFVLLTIFSVLLCVTSRLQVSGGLAVSFAAYGALHALALVLALRMRRPLLQLCIFIAMAAALSVMTLRIGLIGMQVSGTLLPNVRLYVLGLSAMSGAVTYGILIRVFRIQELSLPEIVVISIGCMFATYVAIFAVKHFQSLDTWPLAVLWWYAFSGSLWYFDRRHAAQGLSGERTCSGRTPRPRI
jgi:hypothetical protein